MSWFGKAKHEEPTDFPHDSELKTKFGLLGPSGRLYSCGFWGHDDLALALGINSSWDAELLGYLHLSNRSDMVIWRKLSQPPSQAQLDTVFDYCQKHNAKLPDWWKEFT